MAQDLTNSMTGNNVYILTDLCGETTNGLIMQLTQWVNGLSPTYQNNKSVKIYSPYEIIPENIPVLNVWINSGGGTESLMLSVLNMFNMASAHGTIIRTYNIGRANSSASMLAVSGTPGYRFMYQDAYNMIHYGSSKKTMNHPDEMEFLLKDFERSNRTTQNTYLARTKLTEKELSKFYLIEGSGILDAKQCLTKGLCDWIITNDGRFVNNIKNIKTR